ncbi:hypothetical protein GCM10027037_30810 [Mucilaginibacter koreensis]
MKLPKLLTVVLIIALSYYCLRFTVREFIISYVYQFVFGFIAFLGYAQLIKAKHFWGVIVAFTVLICLSKSIISGAVPFLTVLAITLFKPGKIEPVGNFLGAISYSLYLAHIPVMAWINHMVSGYHVSPVALCGLYILIIVPAAYLMYIVIERPALKLSKRVSMS